MDVEKLAPALRAFHDEAITDLAGIGHDFDERLDAFAEDTAGVRERAEQWLSEHRDEAADAAAATGEHEDDDDYYANFSLDDSSR